MKTERQKRQVPAPPRPKRHATAVLYARVSSKDQEREGFSIPAQLRLLRDHAREQRLELIEEFIDVETAKQSGRAGFGRMIARLADDRSCRIILVEKTDRLYRNIRDWMTIADLDVEVHFVKEGTILSEESRSSEKFMHGIRVLMAKNYIDNLSEEVRKGMREKAAQGHWPTVAPVGYQNNLETKRIEVDPSRGPLVAKLFEWYAAGDASLKELTARAFSAGLTHPRSGRKMTKSEIHRILHNPLYHGEFLWTGNRHRGVHEPLISREFRCCPGRLRRVQSTEVHEVSTRFRWIGYVWTLWMCDYGRAKERSVRLLPLHWVSRDLWEHLYPRRRALAAICGCRASGSDSSRHRRLDRQRAT
jgi:DNA invertase Pin-like site-specific DNA recombinase